MGGVEETGRKTPSVFLPLHQIWPRDITFTLPVRRLKRKSPATATMSEVTGRRRGVVGGWGSTGTECSR